MHFTSADLVAFFTGTLLDTKLRAFRAQMEEDPTNKAPPAITVQGEAFTTALDAFRSTFAPNEAKEWHQRYMRFATGGHTMPNQQKQSLA